MNVPFVSFKPLEKELDTELRAAFNRVYENSWYIDGKEVFRRGNDRFHRPLHVTFDCEIMYSWVGEPDKGGLPQVFSIDWFKYRPLTENSKDL